MNELYALKSGLVLLITYQHRYKINPKFKAPRIQ